MSRYVAVLAVLLLPACDGNGNPPPPPPLSVVAKVTMDPGAWTFQHSFNVPSHPTARDANSWEFNFPSQNGAHYLVHPVVGKLAGGAISATFQVERSGQLLEVEPCGSENVARVRLYFQRRGDDLTAQKEFFRWWSVDTLPLNDIAAATELRATMDPNRWSSVLGKNGEVAVSEWAAAAADVQAVGMTFGGCFAGHGVYGPGKLIVTGYSLQ